METEFLEPIQCLSNLDLHVALGEPVNQIAELLLVHLIVHIREIRRQGFIEQGPTQRRVQHNGISDAPIIRTRNVRRRGLVVEAQLDRGTQR